MKRTTDALLRGCSARSRAKRALELIHANGWRASNGDHCLILGGHVFVTIAENDRGALMLNEIWVDPELRKRGIGDLLLEFVLWTADVYDIDVWTRYYPYGPRPRTPRERLRKWYEGHGFVLQERVDGWMVREPQHVSTSSNPLPRAWTQLCAHLRHSPGALGLSAEAPTVPKRVPLQLPVVRTTDRVDARKAPRRVGG